MKNRVYIETSVVSFLCGRLNTKDKLARQLQEHTRQPPNIVTLYQLTEN